MGVSDSAADLWTAFRESNLYRTFINPPSRPAAVEKTFQEQSQQEGRWFCVAGWATLVGLVLVLAPTDVLSQTDTRITWLLIRGYTAVGLVCLFFIGGLLFMRFFQRHPFRCSWVGVLFINLISIYFSTRIGSPPTTSFMRVLWGPLLIAGVFRWGLLERVFWSFLAGTVVMVSYIGLHDLRPGSESLGTMIEIYLLIILVAITLGHFIHNLYRTSYFRGRELEKERERLAQEHQRSEELLLNILPESVADQLKHDQKHLADGYTDATVLFADLVGFTSLADRLPPDAVVRLLDDIFSSFDDCLQDYHVEKIKTIGDRYFAVSGIPETREDHAEQAALLALDLQETMEQFAREEGEAFQLRVGLHTGSLVAGVIGKEKFSYDVWGDTVNVASRVEEEGMPGKIQVTPTTKTMLEMNSDLDFRIESRGEVELEGKGTIETFFLESVKGDGKGG